MWPLSPERIARQRLHIVAHRGKQGTYFQVQDQFGLFLRVFRTIDQALAYIRTLESLYRRTVNYGTL